MSLAGDGAIVFESESRSPRPLTVGDLHDDHRDCSQCQAMTAWQNARIKSSVGAAFYPCCALAELLVAKV